jgi:hypothetical protein
VAAALLAPWAERGVEAQPAPESDVKEAAGMMWGVGRSRRVSASGAPRNPASSRGSHFVGSPPGARLLPAEHFESSASQPGRNAARLRRRSPTHGFVAWPIATGVFFGVVTARLVHWGAGEARAVVSGALVGLLTFSAYAFALSTLHNRSAARATAAKRTARSGIADLDR